MWRGEESGDGEMGIREVRCGDEEMGVREDRCGDGEMGVREVRCGEERRWVLGRGCVVRRGDGC